MRRVLVDHARRKGRAKRGGGLQRAAVDVSLISARSAADVLAVHEAIQDLGNWIRARRGSSNFGSSAA